jgi:uncharacterized membrane protein YbhN (UPF0104 family)
LLSDNKKNPVQDSQVKPSRLSPGFSTIVKICITVTLLTFIYSQLELSAVMEKLSQLDFSSVLFIAFLYLFSQLINSLKWRIFLYEAGIRVSTLAILRAFFLGMFINTFGIGTLGGDVARAMAIPCQKGFRAASLATVLADRIHGLTSLLILGTVSLFIVRPMYVPEYVYYILLLFIIALLSSWILGPRIVLFCIPKKYSFRDKLERAFKAFPKKPSSLILATLISFIFHSTQIFMGYKIFQAISTPIDISLAYTAIPFINVASSLPITINGLGVREAVVIYMLQPAGVLNESSVVFAAVWVLVVSLVNAIGGLIVVPSYGDTLSNITRLRKEENQHI